MGPKDSQGTRSARFQSCAPHTACPSESSPATRRPHRASRTPFERPCVRAEEEVVPLYYVRDRRNLPLLIEAQQDGADFLCGVCGVLPPDLSYLLHDFRACHPPPDVQGPSGPVLKPR